MPLTTEHPPLEIRVREIVAKFGFPTQTVAALDENASLAEAGMSSLASVNVMLALEAEFGEFPDRMLDAKVFYSIRSITTALHDLLKR